jgi:TRAP transporter TAXI family solute receptor
LTSKCFMALAAALGLHAAAAIAEVAALGSTALGGTSQLGRTLATVVSEAGVLQMRPQEMANTADYIPLVNAGEMEFGIANSVQATYAVRGTGMSQGRPNANLQMVATLTPFRNAYIVRKDSDIQSVADLRGKRVPVFADRALGDYVTRGFLGNAGLSLSDVEGVAVPNFARMWSSFGEGSTDVSIIVVGSGTSREFDASFGIRYLSFENKPEARARMDTWLPQSYLQEMPAGSVPGINKPTYVNVFDYMLFAGMDVSEKMVYEVVNALWEKEKRLVSAGPLWRGFARESMGKDVGLSYHPGAIRFYREKGVWAD